MTIALTPEVLAEIQRAAEENIAAGDWTAPTPLLDAMRDALNGGDGEQLAETYTEPLHPRGRGGKWVKKFGLPQQHVAHDMRYNEDMAAADPYDTFDKADREAGKPYQGSPIAKLFHVTSADHMGIMDWGLSPGHGRVYLTSNPDYWLNEYELGDKAYQVDTRGLTLYHDPTAPHEDFYTTDPVGPERVSLHRRRGESVGGG